MSENHEKLTDILDLRVLHDVLVHGQGGDVEEGAGDEHCNDARDPSKNAIQVVSDPQIHGTKNGASVTYESDHD